MMNKKVEFFAQMSLLSVLLHVSISCVDKEQVKRDAVESLTQEAVTALSPYKGFVDNLSMIVREHGNIEPFEVYENDRNDKDYAKMILRILPDYDKFEETQKPNRYDTTYQFDPFSHMLFLDCGVRVNYGDIKKAAVKDIQKRFGDISSDIKKDLLFTSKPDYLRKKFSKDIYYNDYLDTMYVHNLIEESVDSLSCYAKMYKFLTILHPLYYMKPVANDDDKTFNPGYLACKVEVYEITDGSLKDSFNVYATNSEEATSYTSTWEINGKKKEISTGKPEFFNLRSNFEHELNYQLKRRGYN